MKELRDVGKFLQVASIDEGIGVMDDSSALFAYIPLEMTPQLQKLESAIAENQLSFQFQWSAPIEGIWDFQEKFGNAGITAEDLPVSFSNATDIGHIPRIMDVQSGLALKSKFSDALFGFSKGVHHDWAIGRFMVQANGKKFTLDGEHTDGNTITTINMYLSGRGMSYKVDGYNIRMKPPIVTIHRGDDHPLAIDNPSFAVPHQGFEHDINERRANLLMTLTERNILIPRLGEPD